MKNKFIPLNLLSTLLDAGVYNTIDILLYKILLLENKIEQDIVVDLVATQKRVKKLCKKYSLCKVTVKRSLKRLAKAGLIKLVYDVAFGKVVVHVVPFPGLIDLNNDAQTDVSPEKSLKQSECEENKKTGISQQQHRTREHYHSIKKQELIREVDRAFKSVGVNYHPKDLPVIASYGIQKIKEAIKYYKKKRLTTHIPNPPGWLRSCLRYGYKDSCTPLSVFEKLQQLTDTVLDEFGTMPSEIIDLMFQKNPESLYDLITNYNQKKRPPAESLQGE